jgi:hypothetical protein
MQETQNTDRKDDWSIKIENNKIDLKRLKDGKVIEVYRPFSMTEAPVVMAAIIQGFEPPRVLRDLDTQTD